MNSMRTRLNLRTLASARIARTNGLLTSIFAMALGATVIAGSTPALAAAQNDDPAVASTPAPTISLEEATAQHQTIKLVALIPEEESETPAPSTEGDLPFPSLTPNGSSAYTPLAATRMAKRGPTTAPGLPIPTYMSSWSRLWPTTITAKRSPQDPGMRAASLRGMESLLRNMSKASSAMAIARTISSPEPASSISGSTRRVPAAAMSSKRTGRARVWKTR